LAWSKDRLVDSLLGFADVSVGVVVVGIGIAVCGTHLV